MNSAEFELLTRAVTGDRDALSTLLEQFGPAVEEKLQIGSRWQGVFDAGDVMQVTYVEAFLRIGTFDPARGASFSAWLRQIAENNLRDAVRELSAKKQPPADRRVALTGGTDSYIGLFDVLAASSQTPSLSARRREAQDLLNAAVDRLPKDYADAVRLYDLEGRSIDDAAAALNRSPGAVHMLRQRAHDRLRELLGAASQILDSRS